MKIYINREPVSGPWGGGNKTVVSLIEHLRSLEHEVVFSLQKDIDLIFCFDPRPNRLNESYIDLLMYKQKNNTKIIQRVGDIGTHSKPELTKLVKQTLGYSDYFIFPSLWAKETIEFDKNNFSVIDNAPLPVFHKYKIHKPVNGSKIKVITHHWSTNKKKGFDFYTFLDNLEFIDFLYIGKTPHSVTFKNQISATGDMSFIAKKLAQSDVYLTASVEEAGANHVLEALASGLPIVYHKAGGSIENYCKNYGLSFSSKSSMVDSINSIKNNYQLYKNKAMAYNNTINNVVSQYMEVINEVICN